MLQTGHVAPKGREVGTGKGSFNAEQFVIKNVMREDFESGFQSVAASMSSEIARRMFDVYSRHQKFISRNIAADGFAYVLRCCHPNEDNQNTETITQLAKMFLFTENTMLKVMAGVVLKKFGWNVSLPMDQADIDQAYQGFQRLSIEVAQLVYDECFQTV